LSTSAQKWLHARECQIGPTRQDLLCSGAACCATTRATTHNLNFFLSGSTRDSQSLRIAAGYELSTCLLARRIGRTANMQMAQIPQRRLVLVAHSFGELRIIQSLVPRRLRHILQYAQPLPNRLTPFHGHLPPLWQHIISDVTLLLRSHPAPLLSSPVQFLSLRRRKISVLVVVLENPLPVLRRQVAEFPLRLRRIVRGRRPVRIVVGIGARTRHGVRLVPAASLRISRSAVRTSPVLRRLCRILRLLMLRRPVLRFRRRMLLRRPMCHVAALRHRRGGQHGA
jgi:hypothetical protein